MKWLLALLLLNAAKSIDPKRPFSCTTTELSVKLPDDEQFNPIFRKSVCKHYNLPFLEMSYDALPNATKVSCKPVWSSTEEDSVAYDGDTVYYRHISELCNSH